MPDQVDLVDLHADYDAQRESFDAAIREVCEATDFVGGGPSVRAFEEAFSGYVGAAATVGVANGTDAIELLLLAAGLPRGSRVLVPANTFIATAEAVVSAGLEPRFVDVAPDTGLLDLEQAAAAVDDSVRAVIPVHLYGRVVDMDAVMALAAERELLVIEDAAQAHGARRGGRHAGTFGHAGTFSFYPSKNLGAFGDAGAVVTGDADLAERVRKIANHGRQGDGHALVGVNSRMDGIQAAVLRIKLGRLDEQNAARRAVAEIYRRQLDPALLDWTGGDEPEAESHHLFPILVDDRDAVAARLRELGIATGVHYRHPVPGTEAFGGHTGDFPVAEGRAARQLSLPIHPYMDAEQAERVCAAVAETVGTPASSVAIDG
jgi:dTDP-4-amino-4,6-dideoxygalactose transaminase